MSESQSRSTADAVQNLLPGQYLVSGEHDRISTVPNIALRIIELSTSSSCPLGRSSAFVLAPDSWQNYPTTARAVGASLTGQPGGSYPRKRNAGRKPKYAGPIREALAEEFEQRGELLNDKEDWSHQAHAEKAVSDRLGNKDLYPAESVVRGYVSTFLKDRKKMNLKADNSIV
jgi:hypothetical protein